MYYELKPLTNLSRKLQDRCTIERRAYIIYITGSVAIAVVMVRLAVDYKASGALCKFMNKLDKVVTSSLNIFPLIIRFMDPAIE